MLGQLLAREIRDIVEHRAHHIVVSRRLAERKAVVVEPEVGHVVGEKLVVKEIARCSTYSSRTWRSGHLRLETLTKE